MRTPFIAAAALAVVASTASAANFDVNALDATLDDISSGTSDVLDCTAGLQTDLVPGSYVPTVNDWDLASVTVVAAPVLNNDEEPILTTIGERCAGFVVTVVVESNIDDTRVQDAITNTASVQLASITVDGQDELSFPALADMRISEIDEISILVDRPNTFTVER